MNCKLTQAIIFSPLPHGGQVIVAAGVTPDEIEALKQMTHSQSRSQHGIWLALFFLAGIMVYSNSWNVPFQFDDHRVIEKNPSVSNPMDIRRVWSANPPSRFLPYLSFAASSFFTGTDVTGYHFFNIMLHIFNSFWTYFLILLLLKTPHLREKYSEKTAVSVAGFSALIFLCHPLQTEAVTYIVQRITAMAAFFYLGAIVFYLKARLGGRSAYYFGAWAMTFAAMFCRENAFSLPIALILVEGLFFDFDHDLRKAVVRLTPFLMTLFIIPLLVRSDLSFFADKVVLIPMQENAVSRGDYFLTELNALGTYLRLFLFPVNQNLDYDYPIAHSLFEIKTLCSFFLLTGLFLFAMGLLRKNRLVSFVIFWFFLTLSVESSIFPIRDVIFEHRMYLPLVGCATFLSLALVTIFRKRVYFLGAGMAVLLAFSGMTYARNQIWKTEISLWEDVIRKSPNKARGYGNLGNYYCDHGDKGKGQSFFERAHQKDPRYMPTVFNLGLVYEEQGKIDQALLLYRETVELAPWYYPAYDQLGLAYQKMGDLEKAANSYKKAIDLNSRYALAYKHLGSLFRKKGDRVQAVQLLKESLRWDPRDKETARELYKVYLKEED